MAAEESLIRTPPRPSAGKRFWKSISIVFESRIATVGLAIVVFWIAVGIISFFWTPFEPNAQLFKQNLPPNSTNWLGTDNLGRDIASRIMVGTQPILLKTDLPAITLGNYVAFAAAIALLISFLGPLGLLSVWAQKGRRGLKLPGLFVGWVALSLIILAALPEVVQFRGQEIETRWYMAFMLGLGLFYLGLFVFGWIRVKALGLAQPMRTWTITLVVAIGLALLSIPLQAVQLPGFPIPIGVAIWGVIGSLIVGSLLGLNSGYRGGSWDQTIMQGLDALIAFPVIVLYLVLVGALAGQDQQVRELVVILAITVTGTPGVARLVRSLALDIKTRDYIRAAETRGESINFIMFREILPNARGPILVDAMLRVGYAIFAIGTLGFLGLGLPPPDPDWGTMVADARQFIFLNPIAVIWPALAVASLVIGLNFFADGLREELTRYQK